MEFSRLMIDPKETQFIICEEQWPPVVMCHMYGMCLLCHVLFVTQSKCSNNDLHLVLIRLPLANTVSSVTATDESSKGTCHVIDNIKYIVCRVGALWSRSRYTFWRLNILLHGIIFIVLIT